jgi:hypothetical protein
MISTQPIYVKVPPSVTGEWYDPISRLWFSQSREVNGVIEIPVGTNLSNINRYFTHNYLINVTAQKLKERMQLPKIEQPKPTLAKTPNKILLETTPVVTEVITEEVAEEVIVPTETPTDESFDKVECQFCGGLYSAKGVKTHEKRCKENPANTE